MKFLSVITLIFASLALASYGLPIDSPDTLTDFARDSLSEPQETIEAPFDFDPFGNGCIPIPCPYPAFCSAYYMGTYTLPNGTVCPGCPVCTEWNWPELVISPRSNA